MAKMDDDTLLSVIKHDIDSSTGKSYEELNSDRAKALKYYLGEPYGNESKGRSSIVTTEVADTIESMLPQILKPFVAQDRVVEFDPVGPDDEEAAKQETAYVNHVFYKENDGVNTLYTWAKDGLMSKNGFVKYFWDEEKEVTTESYTNLFNEELMGLLAQDGVEVSTHTETMVSMDTPQGPMEQTVHDVEIKRTISTGRVCVLNVPPEEFLFLPEESSWNVQDMGFCGHDTTKTVSDLVAMGYKLEDFEDYIGTSDPDEYDDQEKEQRFSDISNNPYGEDDGAQGDPSLRKVKYTEVYKRVDYDGDGFAELRKVCLINDKHILSNDEIDYIPFVSWTPIPMTHRFAGRSAADQAMDLQLQKSTVLRNIFDNFYLTNNVRNAVVEGEVNLGDLLNSAPGAAVRQSQPGMIEPLQTQQLSTSAFGLLEYLDSIKENRTGVTRYNQGIDADSLNKTASGINRIMDASAQRLELISKLFGEGVKRLMLGIHRLLLQNQDKQKVISVAGSWVPVSPTEWRERTNMTVMVGLGTGDKDKMLQYLMMVLQIQKEAMAAQLPIVQPHNLYNTLSKLIENAGLKEVSQYFTDPKKLPPQKPKKPSAEEQLIMAQAKAAEQETTVKAQENQQDYEVKLRELALKERQVEIDERKLAMEELTMINAKQDEAMQAALDARRAEYEAQAAAQ